MGRNPMGYSPTFKDIKDRVTGLFKKKKPYTINVPLQTKTIQGTTYKFPSVHQQRIINRILNEPDIKNMLWIPVPDGVTPKVIEVGFMDGVNQVIDINLLERISKGIKYNDEEAEMLNSYRETFKKIINNERYMVRKFIPIHDTK